MNKSKCPHCSEVLTAVRVERVDGEIALTSKSPLVSFACKNCSKVIAIGPDPDEFKRDLRDTIREQMRRLRTAVVV